MSSEHPVLSSSSRPLQAAGTAAGRLQRRLDGLALALTGVCGIHCLLTPVLLITFPILGGSFLDHERFHIWMLAAILPSAAVAVFLGCRKHKDRAVFVLTAAGLSLLVLAAVLGHELHSMALDRTLTSVGGVVLAFAHVRNFRLCRKAECCHD